MTSYKITNLNHFQTKDRLKISYLSDNSIISEIAKTFGVTHKNLSRMFADSYFFSAVSDAIRTSLGPRGMDKMV